MGGGVAVGDDGVVIGGSLDAMQGLNERVYTFSSVPVSQCGAERRMPLSTRYLRRKLSDALCGDGIIEGSEVL